MIKALFLAFLISGQANAHKGNNCEYILSGPGALLQFVIDLHAEKMDAAVLRPIAGILSDEEKIKILTLVRDIAPASLKKAYLQQTLNVLNPSIQSVVESSTHFPEIAELYFTPERLRTLTVDSAQKLLVFKALVSAPAAKFSLSRAQVETEFPDEQDRLNLAVHYVQVLSQRLGHDFINKSPAPDRDPSLSIIRIAHRFGLENPEVVYQLTKSYLDLELLYALDSHGKLRLQGHKDDPEASWDDFKTWLMQWPETQRAEVALRFADQAKALRLVYWFNFAREFELHDPDLVRPIHVSVLKMFLKRWGSGKRFQDLKTPFLEHQFSADPWDLIRWSLDYKFLARHVSFTEFKRSLQEFSEGDKAALKSFWRSLDVKRGALKHYGLEAVAEIGSIDNFLQLPLRAGVDYPNEPTLQAALLEAELSHQGVWPVGLIDHLVKGTGDRETFLFLLAACFKKLEELEKIEVLDFNGILSTIFPWPKGAIAKWSKQGRHDVLALAAEIHQLTGQNIFIHLPLDREAFPGADDVSVLLEMVRNIYQLEAGNTDLTVSRKNPEPTTALLKSIIQRILTSEPGDVRISASNIKPFVALSRDLFTSKIRDSLHVDGDIVQFTYDELIELTERWSDIEPVLTLFARLAKPETRRVVLDIFRHSLSGTFSDYKFRHPEADSQVGYLSPAQMGAWTQKRVLITAKGLESGRNKESELTAEVNQILNDDILPRIRQLSVLDASNPISDAQWSALILRVRNGNPLDVFKDFLSLRDPTIGEPMLGWAARKALDSPTTSDRRDWIRVLLGLVQAIGKDRIDQGEGLEKALKVVEKKLPRSNLSDLENAGLIVTVVDHSPRLLLTVGDLVQTNSCQNYKSGSVVRTLPGYVIDANVQVMASFHIESRHFSGHNDYRAVVEGLHSKSLREVNFDGNKRVLNFIDSRGRKISSGYLGYAHLRQMLKLGSVQDVSGTLHPSLRLEKEYSQAHPDMDLMQTNHRKILDKIAAEMSAIQDQRMSIPRSRNPEGVYSDIGIRNPGDTGVRIDSYEIDPHP